MNGKCCSTCYFFENKNSFCRRNPPIVVVEKRQSSDSKKNNYDIVLTKFPVIIRPDIDWCGEHVNTDEQEAYL